MQEINFAKMSVNVCSDQETNKWKTKLIVNLPFAVAICHRWLSDDLYRSAIGVVSSCKTLIWQKLNNRSYEFIYKSSQWINQTTKSDITRKPHRSLWSMSGNVLFFGLSLALYLTSLFVVLSQPNHFSSLCYSLYLRYL